MSASSLRRVSTLDFRAGIFGPRSRSLSLGAVGRRRRRISFSVIRRLALVTAVPAVSYRAIASARRRATCARGAALTNSPSVFSRARGAAAALPSGPGRWRAAPPFFSFSVFRRRLQLRGRPRRAPDRAHAGIGPVNASAPCFSRTREEPRRHRVLVRRGGAPRCHFSFSVFRRRLQLRGRPRRAPDRAHAGIKPR